MYGFLPLPIDLAQALMLDEYGHYVVWFEWEYNKVNVVVMDANGNKIRFNLVKEDE